MYDAYDLGTDWSGYDFGLGDLLNTSGGWDIGSYWTPPISQDPSWVFASDPGLAYSGAASQYAPLSNTDAMAALESDFGGSTALDTFTPEQISSLSNTGGLLGDVGAFLETGLGKAGITAAAGLIGQLFKSKSAEETATMKQEIQKTLEYQGWAPDLVNKFMASLDQFGTFMGTLPKPGPTAASQGLYEQQLANLSQYGTLQGDLATRQGLEQAMGTAQIPMQDYLTNRALISDYLAQQPAQTAKELQEKYGEMVGTSSTHGKALEQMIYEDQRARQQALQWGAEAIRSGAQIPTSVAGQTATMAPQIGATYPGTGNISNYLGFTQYPQSQTVSDVTKLMPAYQAYPGSIAQGFGAAYKPNSETQNVTQKNNVPTGSNAWLYTGLANAIGQIGQSLATGTAKETQATKP